MTVNMSIADWIERVAEQFAAAGLHYGHGTDNPRDEAAWLVLHAAGMPLDGSFNDWAQAVETGVARDIEQLVRERCATGKPLAYLVGTAYFAGLEFEITEDVLVPRSPLAELVREGFRPWGPVGGVSRVLDMCTGSGCIGIATAVHMPEVRVDLADISGAALDVARRNVARHNLGHRVRLFETDLFASLPEDCYELIVANPPYVPESSVAGLPREYQQEPLIGLASGGDGLDAPLAILLDAPRFLCEDGALICEVGESEERLETLLPDVPFTWLEFAHGGSGVFVLNRQQLVDAAVAVAEAVGKRNDVT